MEIVLGISALMYGIIMLAAISRAIILKKKVYYKYTDTSKTVTTSDYFSNYDGSWFAKDIGLDNLLTKHYDDLWLQKTGKSIKRCQVTFLLMFVFIIVIGVLSKIYGFKL